MSESVPKMNQLELKKLKVLEADNKRLQKE